MGLRACGQEPMGLRASGPKGLWPIAYGPMGHGPWPLAHGQYAAPMACASWPMPMPYGLCPCPMAYDPPANCPMVLWPCGPVALWPCSPVAVWRHDAIGVSANSPLRPSRLQRSSVDELMMRSGLGAIKRSENGASHLCVHACMRACMHVCARVRGGLCEHARKQSVPNLPRQWEMSSGLCHKTMRYVGRTTDGT